MHEKPSEARYSECTFMANFGLHCGKDVGCRARKIKRTSFFNKLKPDMRTELQSQVEQAAAHSGCPNFSQETPPREEQSAV